MKHLKLFEQLDGQLQNDEIKNKYNIGDYVLLDPKRNWSVYNICKIIDKQSYVHSDADYYIECFHLDTYNKKYELWIDEHDIKRKANIREIENFEMLKNVNKYNV